VLGLLEEPESLGVALLIGQGATVAKIREAAEAHLPAPEGDGPELIPYDPASRKVLELTFREALRLGHNYIGTEHLVLALLENEDGDGVLSGLGLEKDVVEGQLVEALAAMAPGGE
jgi:ATP-dependent Clp protease ATP-binding subunit ClpA